MVSLVAAAIISFIVCLTFPVPIKGIVIPTVVFIIVWCILLLIPTTREFFYR